MVPRFVFYAKIWAIHAIFAFQAHDRQRMLRSQPSSMFLKEKDVGYLSMYTQLWATCAIFIPCLTEMGILFISGAKIQKVSYLRQVFGRKMSFVAYCGCCRMQLRKNLSYFLDLAYKHHNFASESRSKRVSKQSFFILSFQFQIIRFRFQLLF